jgi:hypothetical protein
MEVKCSGGNMSKKTTGSIISLVLGLTGLWPILFFAAFVILLVFAGQRTAEFSLEPKNTQTNQFVLVIALAVTAVIQLTAITIGTITRVRTPRRGPGRGLALTGILTGAVGFLFLAVASSAYVAVASKFSQDEGELSAEERAEKCKDNQKHIEFALSPDMWGYDHPDMTQDEIAGLNLSPHGDLINNDNGILYIDPEFLDCPEDDNPDDTDYSVVINADDAVSVICIDEAGKAAGHND